jgi:phage host-nuclease inhibitor protein Gam
MKIEGTDGVDRALARLATLERRHQRAKDFEGGLLDKVRARVAKVVKPIKAEFKRLKGQLERWTFGHRDELDQKTLRGMHGAVRLYKTPDAIVSDLTDDEIVTLLKKHGHKDCVRTKEAPDRVAMKELTDAQLKQVGCTRDSQDEFQWQLAGETEWR